jgi:hypothetical protein
MIRTLGHSRFVHLIRKRSAWAVASILLLSQCFATDVVRIPIKKNGAGPLFQISRQNKWGYMNRAGGVLVPPQFDDEGDFFGGRARVQKDGRWGYLDEAGRVAIDYQFDSAGDFHEGLAPVQVGRKWGFIDPIGRYVIEPRFQAVAEFHDGLSRFELWESVICGSDVYGKENAPLRAFMLHDAMSPVMVCSPRDVHYGFIDLHGRIVIPPTLLEAEDFSEGLAAVRPDQLESKYGYIDKTGKMVIAAKFDQANAFSEGLAAVETGFRAEEGRKVDGKWGFIDHSGKFAVAPRFELARSYSERLAEVSPEGGRWGFINRSGLLVIPPLYSETRAFSDSLALVWPVDEEHPSYIDGNGKTVMVPKFDAQWPFSDGLTVVGPLGNRTYMDRQGHIVAPYETPGAGVTR